MMSVDELMSAKRTLAEIARKWREWPYVWSGRASQEVSPICQILTLVDERPDATLKEFLAALGKRRIRTSRSALWRFLDRHNITRKKKSLRAAEQDREDVARARRKWIREQWLLDPARLVFIDETAVNTNMVRLYGRGPRGVRLVGHVPFGNWETITFVSALRHDKMVAPMVVDGPMNGELFLAYVEQCLVPTLKPNDIVVVDNLQAHKVPGIAEAIEAAGATLRYLPQYSPDLNPIEMPFSKFKAYLRKLAERTVPGVHRAIRSFLLSLKGQECANYLRHAGYASIWPESALVEPPPRGNPADSGPPADVLVGSLRRHRPQWSR
jgi:transposase